MLEALASILLILLGVSIFAGLHLRDKFDRLKAQHAALTTEHENMAIAYGLLTDRDERGRFVKKERADGQ